MFYGTGQTPKGKLVDAVMLPGQNKVRFTFEKENVHGPLSSIDLTYGSTVRFGPKETPDAVPEAAEADVAGPDVGADPQPDFPGPVATEAPDPAEEEGVEALPKQVRNIVGPGDKVYVHPQGAAIIVSPDGAVVKYGPDGKPKKTSATAAKLAVGHGQWEPVAVSKAKPQPKPTEPDTVTKPLTDYPPAQAVVVSQVEEPEVKSVAVAPSKHRVPMNFNEVEVTEVPKYIEDDRFHFQQKVDGIRGQLVIEPGKAPWFRSKSGDRLVNSSAAKITKPLLAKLGAQSDYEGPSYTVDGELLDGKWYVFDVAVDGAEKTPWSDRMSTAEAWVAEMHKAGLMNVQALPVARTPEEKRALWDAVHASGGEGVMIKRHDAPYQYGARVNHTVKAKITSTADVYVLERDRGGKENAVIGVMMGGKMTEIGTVSMQGKPPVQPGEVIEVEYLWAMPGTHKLQQPRMKKRRPDKKQEDATTDQFRYVSKDVVEIDAGETPSPEPEATPEPALEPIAPKFEPPYGYTPKHFRDADRSEVKAGSSLQGHLEMADWERTVRGQSYSKDPARADEMWEEAWPLAQERMVGEGVSTYIATPADRMLQILADGRMKSAFEAKTTGGQAGGYMQARRWFEKNVMGIGAGKPVPTKQRPIYGYRSREPEDMSNYGNVNIKLKPSADARTTVTGDDSLNAWLTPMPLDEVRNTSAKDAVDRNLVNVPWHIMDKIEYGEKAGTYPERDYVVDFWGNKMGTYTEAQIHGGVTVDDIEAVLINRTSIESEVKSLVAARHYYHPPSEWRKLYDAAKREQASVEKLITALEEMGVNVEVH